MPDPTTTPADQYDLGDTDLNPRLEAERLQPHVPQERNPDGTFKAPTPVPVVPTAPKHPNYLVQQAADFGVPDAEIESMSTDQLGQTLVYLNRQRHALMQQAATERSLQPTPAPAPTPPPPEDEIDLGIDETQFAPELIEAIKRASRHAMKKVTDRNSQLEATVGNLAQREAVREQRSASEVLDAAFAALGESYKKYFGEGEALAMPEGSADLKRRVAVLRSAGVDMSKDTPAVIRKKIKEMAETMYSPSEPAQAAPDPYGVQPNGRITPEQWRNGAVARPTQRGGAQEPAGTDKAIKNLAAKMREQGIEVSASGPGDKDVLDGLLG